MARMRFVELIQQGQDGAATESIHHSHGIFLKLAVDDRGAILSFVLFNVSDSMVSRSSFRGVVQDLNILA